MLNGKSSESVQSLQCTMLKACEACTAMGRLKRTVLIRKTFLLNGYGSTDKVRNNKCLKYRIIL